MKTSMLRSLSLLALASCALSAQAADAFSNLTPPSNTYEQLVALAPAAAGLDSGGFQFTSGLSGSLSGFQMAINQIRSGSPSPLSVNLYADSGTNTLGSLLGTYGGTSTGVAFGATDSALATVAASGPSLVSGDKYWLIVKFGSDAQVWNLTRERSDVLFTANGAYEATNLVGAFSVQVADAPSAVPGPVAALPFALMALKRRRTVRK